MEKITHMPYLWIPRYSVVWVVGGCCCEISRPSEILSSHQGLRIWDCEWANLESTSLRLDEPSGIRGFLNNEEGF